MEHNELEEMREQMALLNQKLDKEEIVSDEAISEVTRKNMDKVQRKALIGVIALIIVIPLLAWDCYSAIGSIFYVIWGLSALCGNLMLFIGIRNFKKKCNSVAESIETIQKTKKRRKITDIINKACLYAFLLSLIIAIVDQIIRVTKDINDVDATINLLADFAFFIMTIIVIGSLIFVFRELGKNEEPDNVLSQVLEELQEPNITETDGNETIADAETEK